MSQWVEDTWSLWADSAQTAVTCDKCLGLEMELKVTEKMRIDKKGPVHLYVKPLYMPGVYTVQQNQPLIHFFCFMALKRPGEIVDS